MANNLGPSQLAIILSFIAAFAVFMRNRDSGVVRALSILGFAIVAGSAVAGLALDSGKAFAAQNIVSDIAFVIIGIVSLAIGKPFVGPIARELVPAIKPLIADPRRIVAAAQVLNILMNVIQAVARIWHYGHLDERLRHPQPDAASLDVACPSASPTGSSCGAS
ncbi:MAG: hypothetical protein U5Q44_04660 [Dehalococcoidia bacterium]|nr:hypothetical protein [Dehalococcoidia bacterium]